MSNQPTRPWFRLASISRPAPQAPTPTPEPAAASAPQRSATIRPAFRPVGGASSVPTSPVSVGRTSQPSSPSDRKEASPKTASVPNSPVKTSPTAARPTTSPPKQTTPASLPSSSAKPVATTASVPSSPAKSVTTTASVPTSPARTVATAVSPPTSSPAKTVPTTTSVTNSTTPKPAPSMTTTNRVASPKASTIPTVKPAMQSPVQSTKIKAPTAPPPSPLTLPPPQLRGQAELEPKIPVEAEQKTVLVQKMIEKPRGLFGAPQKDVGDTRDPSIHGKKEPSKYGDTKEKGNGKKFASDSEDAGMRVITIAGENKGAFMELIKSPHKNGFQGSPHRLANSSRIGSDGSDYHSYSSSEDGDGKMKAKSNGSNTMPMSAFMNSNVQGVNNSIVYNSSCTHHDPGVHLSLHRKPTAGGFHVKERTNGYNS
ncbi:hypothetical protein Gotur_035597 [Gossypium turneri]